MRTEFVHLVFATDRPDKALQIAVIELPRRHLADRVPSLDGILAGGLLPDAARMGSAAAPAAPNRNRDEGQRSGDTLAT